MTIYLRYPGSDPGVAHVLKRQQEVCIYFIRVSTAIPHAYERTMACTKQKQEFKPPP